MSKFTERWNRLSFRLPLLIAVFAALTGLVGGGISYIVAERGFLDIAKERMELVRNERMRAVSTQIQDARMGLGSLVTRPGLAEDIKDFSREFARLTDAERAALITIYTTGNPYPSDSRSAFNASGDSSGYTAKHKASHDRLLRLLQIKELADIMLIDMQGNIVYSVVKEEDFGTNLLSGPFKDTIAAKVFRKAVTVEPPWEQAFSDMEVYPPSNAPALFMAQVVNDAAGAPAGVLMFQLNNAKLRDAANHIQDLGTTGEVYLVGPDATRRSETRFIKGGLVTEKIDTLSATRAAGGFTETVITTDYKGDTVVSAYAPVDLMGVTWGIVSKIDLDEALAPLQPVVTATGAGVLLSTLLIALMGYATARRISRPLEASLRVMDKLSQGNLDVRIEDGNGIAETRQISAALRAFHANLANTQRLQSELEKALAEARDERAKAEAILAGTPDPIMIVRSDSVIEYVNDQMKRVLGYDRDELIGERIERLIPQRYHSGHRAQVRGFFETGDIRLMGQGRELFAVAKNGSEVPVEIALSPIRVGARPVVVAQIRDITAGKAAEKAIREARDAAEAAAKAKSDFLAVMSHEIRTPMNGVTGMADLLSQTTLDDDQRHMVQTIRESGNSLLTVINDILDFSKIEAGKMDLESVTMSVVDAVEGVAATLTPNAAKKGVRIHVYVDPALPQIVHGDPTRLRQILFNIGGNAVKFSGGKDVQIRAEPSQRSSAGQTWIRFSVIDQGIGLSKDNQAKLFQAFSQAESSTTRRFGGTGLGLAICKRLTDMMGGLVGVDSAEGRGSTFFVELPFRVAEDAKPAAKERDLSGLRVLHVGGSGPRAQAIESYLRHWGADVSAAADSDAVLSLVRNTKFDSIMVDLGLDDERQSQAIGAIRKVVSSDTPIIVLQDYQNRGARIVGKDVVTVDANPLIRYRVISAVAVAAGRASPQIKTEDDALKAHRGKAPSVAEARERGQLILLAEDNLTNQDVIRRQLNLLGYTCELAINGAEALAAYKTGAYALLLTDCHMPEMDGYELTGAIRGLEHGTGKRLPIIAVTANALQGEAERCLAAGMDDFISKPIAMPALVTALRKWMPPPREAPAETEAVIDERAIKDIFGDDDTTFKEILVSFVGPSQSIISDILAARDKRAASDVKDAAHKLKSSARSIGAAALADLCVALEKAGKAGDWGEIDALVPKARDEFGRVEVYISKL